MPGSDMPAKVLVVDDSMVIRAVVRGHLEAEGYVVTEAESGWLGLVSVREDPPDTVLLDIEMPGMSGHQVLAELKASSTAYDIPVVFLTGRTSSDQIVAALRAGAQDYLKKPFEPAELIARVGAAVRTKKLLDELRRQSADFQRLARTDVLTGVFNRRHLEDELRRLGSLAARHNQGMAIAMFDIDHFKQVNDRFGHAAGDEVLREFTKRVRDSIRAEDLVGRWGGEEFLVILQQTGLAGALTVSERIRFSVARKPFRLGDDPIEVTVSGGCSAGVGPDLIELVRQADGALYRAKREGRNRVVAARSQLDEPPVSATTG